jgi:hypothetical protein
MDTSKLDTTPFPADVAEMVLNKESRHPSLQSGPVFVDVTFTDNGSDNMRYRICVVTDMTVDGKDYHNLVISTACADMRDVADKLRDGFFGDAEKREAARRRDEMDAAEADIKAANKARKGAANE